MKKVVGKIEVDDHGFFCDKCKVKCELHSQVGATLKFDFGYGSELDGMSYEAHFCNTCAEGLAKDCVKDFKGSDFRKELKRFLEPWDVSAPCFKKMNTEKYIKNANEKLKSYGLGDEK